MSRDLYNSDWHDPVSKIEVLVDPATGWPYHRGSLAQDQEFRDMDAKDLRQPFVARFAARLSLDPERRSEEIFWLRRRVNPFISDDLLRLAITGKSEFTRGLPLGYLARFGKVGRRDLKVLLRILAAERNLYVLSSCFQVVVKVLGAKAELHALAAMTDPRWRHKYSLLGFFFEHGSAKAVPAVASFVRRAIRRPREIEGQQTDLVFALRFLNRMIDRNPEVVTVFGDVVRQWHNLAHDECEALHLHVKWFRWRTLEPAEPPADKNGRRVSFQTGSGFRRLWKNKERFLAWDTLSPKEQAKRRPKNSR